MKPQFTPEEILTLLAAAPEFLSSLSAGCTAEQLKRPLQPGEWSARHVLAHLKACCDMRGDAMLRMLQDDEPVWKTMNPRTWIKQTDYLEQEFETLLRSFVEQRRELLGALVTLSSEQWRRTGTARGWGQKYARSVAREGDALARHERAHFQQMERDFKALRAQGL